MEKSFEKLGCWGNGYTSVSSLSAELLADMQHLYEEGGERKGRLGGLRERLYGGHPGKGELVVIAARNRELGNHFVQNVTVSSAIDQKQSVALCSSANPILFTRQLLSVVADIPSDVALYDGQMNELERQKIFMGLGALIQSSVYIYPSPRSVEYVDVRKMLFELGLQIGRVDILMVDLMSMSALTRTSDMHNILFALKRLAIEAGTSVIVLYGLAQCIGLTPTVLTRYELSEAEKLSSIADGYMLMAGEPGSVDFYLPKVVKPKPIAWVSYPN